ncbi:MAG: glutamine-hydrolyzing GMP synthase [Candidatus Andersenbacteria bacterium]
MIVVVHFGGQYTQLIRRRVNELGVPVEVKSSTEIGTHEPPSGVDGVILSGGPASVNPDAAACVKNIMSWNVPILGICFGHQALVYATGGKVNQQFAQEYGRARLRLVQPSALLNGLPQESTVWVSHGDTVEIFTERWQLIGTTNDGQLAALEDSAHRLYGVQFHPEVTQTEFGLQILRNFVCDICQATPNVNANDLAEETMVAIRKKAGPEGHLMLACSLGVDSTTLAVLATQALGVYRVHPIFIDNGLQREEDVTFARRQHPCLPNLHVVDARESFLAALERQPDPEAKRRIVGEMFWQTFTEVAHELKKQFPIVGYGQGTIAPDVIESGQESHRAAVIKTHHNLVKPPADFPYVPFEPLRTLYKDQVRAMGQAVGVPQEILTKHPFPGPGLAVRVLGQVTRERIEVARQCDTIFIQALREQGLYEGVAQAGVTILQDTAVCVRGDARRQGWIVALWAVTTEDFMTADVAALPASFLEEVATQLTNTVERVGRVVYSVTRKPPATIEWE